MKMTNFALMTLLSLWISIPASANYRCYNWQVQSIGKEAAGAERSAKEPESDKSNVVDADYEVVDGDEDEKKKK